MRRAIFLLPADTDFEQLPEAVQQHLQDVGFQYIAPMPNTRIIDGMMVADGIAHTDELTPDDIAQLDGQLIYYAEYPDILYQDVDCATYMQYVKDTVLYDEEGNEIGTEPAPHRLTHGWAGWEV